jgi:hypothetical protein
MFAWLNGGFGAQKVFASRVDLAGEFAWTPTIIEPCNLVGGKARLWSALEASGDRLFLTWGDDRDDANDIYAQNINVDGSLGLPGDVNSSGFVDVDDLVAVILGWGACPAPPTFCEADVAPPPAGDGEVDVDDLVAVILNWG